MDDALIKKIRRQLIRKIDKKTKLGFQRYFKEKVKYYGIKSADVVKIAKDFFKEISNDKNLVFKISEELLRSGYCEEAWIAANLTYGIRSEFEKKDFATFENWIKKYIDNWAECDTFCNHTMGFFIEKYPEFIKKLKIWAKSENRWLRRASAVSFIIPAKKGKFINDIFKIADLLLKDQDDLVQKGYGWMLKAASKPYENKVFKYVMDNKIEMPRTALRYAIEKMPKELKIQAMEK